MSDKMNEMCDRALLILANGVVTPKQIVELAEIVGKLKQSFDAKEATKVDNTAKMEDPGKVKPLEGSTIKVKATGVVKK